MNYLLSGGAKNGKSMLAQRIVRSMRSERPIYYLATMIAHDAEDDARIARHRRERAGWGFETLECGTDILRVLDTADPNGGFLFDSVTALLANEMFSASGFDPHAPERVAQQLLSFAARTGHTVFVSDTIGADAGHYDDWTQCYRAGLAHIERTLADACPCVGELCAANVIWYKGGWQE